MPPLAIGFGGDSCSRILAVREQAERQEDNPKGRVDGPKRRVSKVKCSRSTRSNALATAV